MQGIRAGREKREKTQQKIFAEKKKETKPQRSGSMLFSPSKDIQNSFSLPSAPRKKNLASRWWHEKEDDGKPNQKSIPLKTHPFNAPLHL